jgi:hypothetical protein
LLKASFSSYKFFNPEIFPNHGSNRYLGVTLRFRDLRDTWHGLLSNNLHMWKNTIQDLTPNLHQLIVQVYPVKFFGENKRSVFNWGLPRLPNGMTLKLIFHRG